MTVENRRELRAVLERTLADWREYGLPPRWTLHNQVKELIARREGAGILSIWDAPVRMFTATLDDGWGHGLELVEDCARAAGASVRRIGLLQPAEAVLTECRQDPPDLLGLTVLQFDSEDDLRRIADGIPSSTHLLAGGPVFSIDPEFRSRTGVPHVAGNLADFLDFLLSFR